VAAVLVVALEAEALEVVVLPEVGSAL